MNFPDGELKVTVVSAYPLKDPQKVKLESQLKNALKKDFSLAASSDVSLLAGIVVTAASIVIDGSLKFKIREIARRVQRPD